MSGINIGDWFMLYNVGRRHASLSRKTLEQVYYKLPPTLLIAA